MAMSAAGRAAMGSAGISSVRSAARRRSAVTAAAAATARCTGRRPAGIGSATRWRSTVTAIISVRGCATAASVRTIGTSASGSHHRLLHVERWTAVVAAVVAATRVVLILPRLFGRLRIIGSRLRRYLPLPWTASLFTSLILIRPAAVFVGPAAIRWPLLARWRTKRAPSRPRRLNRVARLRSWTVETALALFAGGSPAYIAARIPATIEIVVAAPGLERAAGPRVRAEEPLIAGGTVRN